MNWAAVVGKVTGTVDQHLIQRNDYLLTENRILRRWVTRQLRFTDSERISLAKAAKPLGGSLLAEIATLVKPDKLGYTISDSTVGNILKKHAEPHAPERTKKKTWTDFIATHTDALVPGDFFTKEVWTLTGLVNYYVLFFIPIASRKVYIAGITANPNEQWMKQIARNLTMAGVGFLDGMKYLILDRDGKFAPSFRGIVESVGVEILRLPPRAPNLNAFVERFVRSIKEECLDHLILFGKPSLQRALDNFIEHYHHERPHQGKGNVILFPADSNNSRDGPVQCKQRLGGLLKFYHRKAA